MPSKRTSARTAGKGGETALSATTVEVDPPQPHPRKDFTPPQPQPTVYPTIEPTSAYDLSKDPIHKHWAPDDPVVIVPRHVAKFQRADEAAVHLWPHNAKKLGMVRYIPPLTSEPLAIASSIGITNADGEWEYVWFAFAYTHLKLVCDACKIAKQPCLQVWWDGPSMQTLQYPNPATKSLVAHSCLHCRKGPNTKNVGCSNKGVHILDPKAPKLEMDEQMKRKMVKSTWRWKRPDAHAVAKAWTRAPGPYAERLKRKRRSVETLDTPVDLGAEESSARAPESSLVTSTHGTAEGDWASSTDGKRQRKPPRRYSPDPSSSEHLPSKRSSIAGSSRSTADASVDRVEDDTTSRSLAIAGLDARGQALKPHTTADDALSSVITAYQTLTEENQWLRHKLQSHKQTEENLLVALMNERQETLRVKEEMSRLKAAAAPSRNVDGDS